MKRFIFFMLATATFLYGDTIRWHGSFEMALAASQKSQKPIFVVLVERGCDECRELFTEVLIQRRIVEIVNAKTVPVIVTKENEDHPIELLYTLDYPALFLLSPQEVLLKSPLTGRIDADLLEKELLDEL